MPDRRAAWAVAALCALPGVARAHLAETGLGPFYDGFAHLFIGPETLSSLLALALLAGLKGRAHGPHCAAGAARDMAARWRAVGLLPAFGFASGAGTVFRQISNSARIASSEAGCACAISRQARSRSAGAK